MSKLFLQQFAELDSEQIEMYWLAGLTHNENNAWFVRSVVRGMSSRRFYMQALPIGMWPLLALGMVFAKGNLLSMSARGVIGKTTISDISQYEEITSSDIQPQLYSFENKECGIQRLFRYSTEQGEILIPTMELIRYLFLHNRTLANAIMHPGDLNRLFRPELPGYRPEQALQFTADMPTRCLSSQFAQEFAWLALDTDARLAWDSVYLQSQGKEYATFTPPPLKNSEWTFRGVRHGNCWLVLELLHLTGKCHPCDELYYGHPSLKRIIRDLVGGTENLNTGEDINNNDDITAHQKDRIIYDYQLDDGQAGSKSDSNQQVTDMHSKLSEFDRDIPIKKLLIDDHKQTEKHKDTVSSNGQFVEKRQIIKVSAGEQKNIADLPPLNFNLLTSASWNSLGDLEALSNTVHHMANRLPEVEFAMSLCQLKAGRAFSMANRMPRVALVVTISVPLMPPIVLLDVERTGDIALSIMVLRFKPHLTFEVLESTVKLMLDGLIDASGHWDREIEKIVAGICCCERQPKILIPRENFGVPGQSLVWALKLMSKLRLLGGN